MLERPVPNWLRVPEHMRRRRSTKSSAESTAPSIETKDVGTFKLHVHGLEFHGGEEFVLNLEALKAELTFPEDDVYVMEIYPPSNHDEPRHHLLMDVPTSEELKSKKQVKGKMSLSILKDTASIFSLPALQDVVVRFIEKTRVEVDFVEITMKDQFLSRRDLWYLKQAMVGKALYVGKTVRMHGARLQITELVFENENVTSGVLTPKTCFVFRSKSSRVFWLIQVSPEMWDMANDGNLYAEEMIRMASVIFQKWQSLHVSHSLTIIMFARNLYHELPPESSPYFSKAIVAKDGIWYEDYYKVISYGKNGAMDAATLLIDMKRELNALPHLCDWAIDHGNLVCKGGYGHPASAKDGNVLEALNLILNIYEKHYMDRDLNRSGQNITLFTAGNGIFRVNQDLAEMTEQRMMDNGIGFDVISLSTPPMEPVPRFLFKKLSEESSPAKTMPRVHSQPTMTGMLTTNSSNGFIKVYKEPEFEGVVPGWISISFSRYEDQINSGFEPLPHCRLFAPIDKSCTKPLAFLLQHFEFHPSIDGLVEIDPTNDDVYENNLILSPESEWSPVQIAQTKDHIAASSLNAMDDYDDDMFTFRSNVEKSPIYTCSTPPLHASTFLANPKRLPRTKPTQPAGSISQPEARILANYGLSPELKPQQMPLKSPMHFQLPGRYSSPQPGGSPNLGPQQALTPPKALSSQILGHPRKMTSPQMMATAMQQKKEDKVAPLIMSLNSNKRRWSQIFRYEQQQLSFTLDWKSLCVPALLPLTSDFMPKPQELKHHYTEAPYAITLPLSDGENGVMYTNHRELVWEMVAQRFSQDFQLVEEKQTHDNTTVYKLSMGHRIHEITYNGDSQQIDVKRYQQNRSSDTGPQRLDYSYSMWSPLTQSFLPSKQDFRKYPMGEYAWNYLDQLICGYYDNMTEGIKYKRGHYCVLPPPIGSDAEVLQDYADKFNRFLDYIRLKARGKSDSDQCELHVTGLVEMATSKFNGIHKIKQDIVKIPLVAPDAPKSQQWVNIRYDTEVMSTQCYHMEVQWLVCRSALVDDFITGLQRRAKQFNLDVIPVPENVGSSTLEIHPLVCPVAFPVTKLSILPLLEASLTRDMDFCIEGMHPIPKDLVQYYNLPQLVQSSFPRRAKVQERYYRQYIHRSLACFVRVTDGGVIWISSRRLHSPEMKSLFDNVQHLVASLHEQAPMPSMIPMHPNELPPRSSPPIFLPSLSCSISSTSSSSSVPLRGHLAIPMQFESHKTGRVRRGSDPVPCLSFQRVSPQALGMESVRLCDKSEWQRKSIKDIRCACCEKKLILFGKHNCRVCGDVVCGRCSVKRIKLSNLKSIRTCDKCVQHNLMQFNRSLHPTQEQRQRSNSSRVQTTSRSRAMTSLERAASESALLQHHHSVQSIHVPPPPLARVPSSRTINRQKSAVNNATTALSSERLPWQTIVLLGYGMLLCGVIVFEAPIDITVLLFAILALAFLCTVKVDSKAIRHDPRVVVDNL
ncbi:vacuolar membrane-associated protein [Thraustotheca clavata]|uniref:Vacuolar membrane-associated protein n=1 Tax=Thraustotheca clavata TaxID=74557 RepID=A0A1V9ZVU3_9STRA|nr:vacuolar membrane-associated protein [Thraustotheca clavata]